MSELTQSFRDFERQGWSKESVTATYHDLIAPVTRQAVNALLDAAAIRPGNPILDVATGAGYVAAAAAERGAEVIGLDFSSTQIALAKQTYPGLIFQEGDAENLPFPDGHFEAVVSNFGMPHFADHGAFLRQAFRVLRSGGRIAFSTWASPQEAVGFGIILSAVQAHGNLEVPLPSGPNFFLFSDRTQCKHSLRAAGFRSPEVMAIRLTWRLSSLDTLYQAILNGGVRMSALLRSQTPEATELIQAAMRTSAARFERDGAVELPMAAVIASAVKP